MISQMSGFDYYARGRDYTAMGDHPRTDTDLTIAREIDGGNGEG